MRTLIFLLLILLYSPLATAFAAEDDCKEQIKVLNSRIAELEDRFSIIKWLGGVNLKNPGRMENNNEATSPLARILTEARGIPFYQNSEVLGIRLFAIKPESVWDRAGLRNGDILKQVDNISVTDSEGLLKAIVQIIRSEEASVSITVERTRIEKTFLTPTPEVLSGDSLSR